MAHVQPSAAFVDVTICIATFGASRWQDLAHDHALPSAAAQGVAVSMAHGKTLAHARNLAAHAATTEWLIYLDADDQLAPGYVDAMSRGSGDLRAPQLMDNGKRVALHRRNIESANPCVIGTAIRKTMLADCGGWPEFPIFEDWALFLRASRRGARVEHIADAWYLATSRTGSRNQSMSSFRALRVMREIKAWA